MRLKIAGLVLLALIAVDDFVPFITRALIPHESVSMPDPRGEPLQGEVAHDRLPWNEARYQSVFQLSPRASYDIAARVADRDTYRWGATGALMPTDLVLTWGRLVDEPYRSSIEYVHTKRFYNWGTNDSSVDLAYVSGHSANVHLIPGSRRLAAVIARVRRGDVVRIEGDLVDVAGPDGFDWKTSLTRTDTGAGACETIYVRTITVGKSRYR